MRGRVLVVAILIGGSATSAQALKRASYPDIKVEIAEAFRPDDAFQAMRTKFSAAVASRNADALFALVGPTFVWTVEGGPSSGFDMGRGALDNFKVVFGFRAPGAAAGGGVQDGPYWEALAGFANDASYFKAPDAGNLVCGPVAAGIADDKAFERARARLETDDEPALWYFTVGETPVTAKPDDKAAPVSKVGTVALPVIGVHPPQDDAHATHVEVLLPSGKSGWVAAAAVRPLFANRLCYARTPQGDWKIAAFDQNED